MKNILLTLGLVTALGTGLSAQDLVPATEKLQHDAGKRSLSPAERAKKDAERAEQKLGLNSDQKIKWEAASLQRATANQPIREKMKGCTTPQERKEYHSQMRQNQKKYNETVVALLTPEQKNRYEQMKKEKHASHKSKMKHRHMDENKR